MPTKRYKLRPEEFRQLVMGYSGCYASDHITVDGHRVGWMYCEQSDKEFDGGWRFFSRLESDAYCNDPENFGRYDVNTIANYDREIIPFLDAPPGSAFMRDEQTGKFVAEAFSPPED
jgi:hypothetical protein